MSKKLYPIIYLPSSTSVKVFLRTGEKIFARLFSRLTFKPRILNWRLPDQTALVVGDFNFVDSTGFDFMDGDSFDFMDA